MANTRCWLINSNCQNTKTKPNLYLFREIVVKYVLTPNNGVMQCPATSRRLNILEVEIGKKFIALE